ncbi:TetR/AcrR family transcriptional regulator [Paracoccus sp. S1E-3]|uniref:TetR/AcrR family transcriptional regulator n=1 Tax=Paracoccus sp. S1E-3 TaxID=2756130 RepID=UPI0015EE7788|nr:TetR/AcrR family transcriptional regulator [Paracoccus sp. S1E-3]MBA4491108.1 TetR/AcrR family transcriptional regulator [Paracoccus sp. S1E-3]
MDEVQQSAARLVPTQKRSRARFEAILESAEQILLEKGADAFRMSDIVARAGVPHGSLYQYFPDKTAVIATLALRANAAGQECVAAELARISGPEDVADALRRVTDGYYEMFREMPVMRAIWQATQADPTLQKLDAEDRAGLANLLQARLAQVLAAPADLLDIFARLQITLIGAVVREAITLPEPEGQRLLAQFKRGLKAPDFG